MKDKNNNTKNNIWDKKIHWFKLKIRLIFLGAGILCTIIKILEITIWSRNLVFCLILIIFELIFYGLFFAPLISRIHF